MLQFDDEDLSDIGGYDLVHHDDLAYVASAHQECKPNFKIVYRIVLNHSQPSLDMRPIHFSSQMYCPEKRKFWASFVEKKE